MTTQHPEEVRRQFEAWASGDGSFQYVLERNKDGEYTNEVTYRYWLAYQAALRSPAVAGLVEAATELRQRQRDYLSGPKHERSEEKGRLVGVAAARLDEALAQYATLAGESHD